MQAIANLGCTHPVLQYQTPVFPQQCQMPYVETVQQFDAPKPVNQNAIPLFPNSEPTKPTTQVPLSTPVTGVRVRNRSWMPDLNNVTKSKLTSLQGASIAANTPPKLSNSQSKYEQKDNPNNFIGLMRPKGDALNHPASENLLQYATQGCPVDCGRDWTIEELEAAIKKGPSASVDNPEASFIYN